MKLIALFYVVTILLNDLTSVIAIDWNQHWTVLGHFDHKFLDVNYEYELLKYTTNKKEAQTLVVQIRNLRQEVSVLKINVTTEIVTTDWSDLFDHAMYEILGKSCNAYVEQLNQIAYEVLGFQANLTRLPQTRHSERLDFTLALYNLWQASLRDQLRNLNKLIQERTLRSTIQSEFNEILAKIDKYHTELEKAYEEESDLAHIEEVDLSKVQQRRAEEALDSLTALQIYLKHYWAQLQLYCG